MPVFFVVYNPEKWTRKMLSRPERIFSVIRIVTGKIRNQKLEENVSNETPLFWSFFPVFLVRVS